MKKTILLVVLLTLVAFVSGAIATAPPKGAGTTPVPPAPKLEKFTGDIKSVDAVAKSIVVTKPGKVPEDKTFFVDKMTKITKGGKDLPFADLKAGMNVVVEYKKEMDKLIAVTIKATAPKVAPKAK